MRFGVWLAISGMGEYMRLKDWAFLGNYEFFTSRLQLLATNDLPPEKWGYAGKSDFGILRNYLFFTFEKLWKEREGAVDKEKQSKDIFIWTIVSPVLIQDYMIKHGSRYCFIA